jgi:hypothetical protein
MAGSFPSETLRQLRSLDFINKADFHPARAQQWDGVLVMDAAGKKYEFLVEVKRSYLDRSTLNAVIAHLIRSAKVEKKLPLLVARYIPRPSAERLLEAGINFVDGAGHIHLKLGKSFERTIVGQPETSKIDKPSSLSATNVKALFAFAANPIADKWTVRRLAEVAGISKSRAAQVRQQLMNDGLLRLHDGRIAFVEDKAKDVLLQGYGRVLRPSLLVNRFRSQEQNSGRFIGQLGDVLKETNTPWALTGGPAADILTHFYRGEETPIFIGDSTPAVLKKLRLMPDRDGTVILLKGFGQVTYWKAVDGKMLAHPWLIYCELMHSSDPRAHEAAAELEETILRRSHETV